MNEIPSELQKLMTELHELMGSGLLSSMIGAGFSFNAVPAEPDAEMISWGKLGEKIRGRLQQIGEDAFSTTDFYQQPEAILELADHYKLVSANDPRLPDLDDLIYEISSYEDFKPGQLHRLLLALPWHDIYTTNYDRLLERTQENERNAEYTLINRQYRIVKTADDLPQSRSGGISRIIKLHGSFPDPVDPVGTMAKPYLLAGEDYRAYPEKQKALVQEIRHALVNDVICLIGFSGTDPNFRSWISWVRGALTRKYPQIYLIDFSPLTERNRVFFKANDIIHVNISPFIEKTSCSTQPERQEVLQKFFYSLHPETFAAEKSLSRAWVVEKGRLERQGKAVDIAAFAAWLKQRRISRPDFVFPSMGEIRDAYDFYGYQSLVLPDFRSSGEKESPDLIGNLVVYYEFFWVFDAFCLPLESLPKGMLEKFFSLLEAFQYLENDPDFTSLPESLRLNKDEFISLYQDCLRILMGASRRLNNRDNFQTLYKALSENLVSYPNPEIENWLRYQDILYHIESLDLVSARTLLNEWNTEKSLPVWQMRKAMILAEFGSIKEAKGLLREALWEIRKGQSESAGLRAASVCEAWIIFFIESLNSLIEWEKPIDRDEPDSVEEDKQLRTLKISPAFRLTEWHPYTILPALSEKLNNLLFSHNQVLDLDYHTGKENYSTTLRSGYLGGVQEIHTMLAMVEKTGMPPAIGSTWRIRMEGSLWNNTASMICRLADGFHPMLLPVIHRSRDARFLKGDSIILSRLMIAKMDEDVANIAFEQAFQRLKQFAERTDLEESESKFVIANEIAFLLRYIGRLSARVTSGRLSDALSLLADWHSSRALLRNSDTLSAFLECVTLFLESASNAKLAEYLPIFHEFPVSSEILAGKAIYKRCFIIPWQKIIDRRSMPMSPCDWDSFALISLQQLQAFENSLLELQKYEASAKPTYAHPEFESVLQAFEASERANRAREQSATILEPILDLLSWLHDMSLISSAISVRIVHYLEGESRVLETWPFLLIAFIPEQERPAKAGEILDKWFARKRTCSKREWIRGLLVSLKIARDFPLSNDKLAILLEYLMDAYPVEKASHSDIEIIALLLTYWGQYGLKRATISEDWATRIEIWLGDLYQKTKENTSLQLLFSVLQLEYKPERVGCVAEEIRAILYTQPAAAELSLLFWRYGYKEIIPLPDQLRDAPCRAFNYLPPAQAVKLMRYFRELFAEEKSGIPEAEFQLIMDGVGRLLPLMQYDRMENGREQEVIPMSAPLPLKLPYEREQVALFIKDLLVHIPAAKNEIAVISWLEEFEREPLADIRNILK